MDRLKRHWTLSATGALAWFALGVLPAHAQIYPSFRPSMPMISPIGPRDPAMHTQPGNLSNIPMGGTTVTGTTSDQTGRRTIKKVKQAVTRGPVTNSKIPSQTIAAGSGGRGTGGSSSSTGGSGVGSSGIPPAGETRFPQNEVLVEIRGNPTSQTVDALLRRNRLELLDRLTLRVTNSTILRLRIPNGRSVAATIRALGARTSQPNYQYALADDQTNATVQTAAAPSASDAKAAVGDPAQYALTKLRLREAQGIAKGEKVPVAIIDSGIDVKHPDLNGAVTAQFDALGSGEPPHAHGTAVAGIVAAHGRLLGAAPSVNLLAVRAFGAATAGADGTTFNILKGLDWAAGQGARIINLSFTGPSDPLLARALAALHEKGTILIAAVGNAGPKSPPLYPAADPNVIAVTATDADDQLFAMSNRGGYIAVAAPGADILVLAPDGAYQLSSGTSFAAAYVTGIAALLLERKPGLDPDTLKKALQNSAKDLGPKGRDDQFGAGLADAYQGIMAVDPSADASARATRQ
jgi:subtilisin family serine protease